MYYCCVNHKTAFTKCITRCSLSPCFPELYSHTANPHVHLASQTSRSNWERKTEVMITVYRLLSAGALLHLASGGGFTTQMAHPLRQGVYMRKFTLGTPSSTTRQIPHGIANPLTPLDQHRFCRQSRLFAPWTRCEQPQSPPTQKWWTLPNSNLDYRDGKKPSCKAGPRIRGLERVELAQVHHGWNFSASTKIATQTF